MESREEQREQEINADDSETLTDFTDRMEEVRVSTQGDGEVEAEVYDIVPANGSVRVEFLLPTGEVRSEQMPEPEFESDEYKFVRICREYGATIDTCDDLLLGSRITVERVDGSSWRIKDPQTRLEAAGEAARNAVSGLPFLGGSGETPSDTACVDNRKDLLFGGTIASPLSFLIGLCVVTLGFQDKDGMEIFSAGLFYGAVVASLVTTALFVGLI